MASPSDLAGRVVALCVSGSIAAYKSVEVARLLVKAGARVLPVMTRSGERFVGPVTLSGICSEPVALDMWDPTFAGEKHVALSEQADVVAIVPATADLLARLAQGRADDLVTALALSAKGPVLAAPAMHPRMWSHPATQKNVEELARQGRVTLVGPVSGLVASGDTGMGRMAEPEAIVEAIAHALKRDSVNAPKPRPDLDGRRVVVTAGPTVEDFDPVRFLGNRSTGKMGFAVAERAAARGAEVTLITGPVSLATPPSVIRVDVRSALDMREALWRALGPDLSRAHALVMTAAVADYRPRDVSPSKLKKQGDETTLTLVKNPDLLAEIGSARLGTSPFLVGFAVETGDSAALEAYARGKLVQKKCDLVVANEAGVAFAGDDNSATFVTADGAERLPSMSKHALADRILDQLLIAKR
jgi:phosphopantothenoylcysteine decarboxylase/phosphopantothenate--cysteine ligase